MATKRFTIQKKEERPPIEFELVLPALPAPARPARSRAKVAEPEPRVEVFHATGFMPAWLMIEAEGLQDATPSEASERLMAFFDTAIINADKARWRRVVRDPRNEISGDELGEIFRWLHEEYMGRPTESV